MFYVFIPTYTHFDNRPQVKLPHSEYYATIFSSAYARLNCCKYRSSQRFQGFNPTLFSKCKNKLNISKITTTAVTVLEKVAKLDWSRKIYPF